MKGWRMIDRDRERKEKHFMRRRILWGRREKEVEWGS